MAQQQNRLHNAIRLDGGVAAAFRQLQALFANNPDKPDRPSKSDRSSNPGKPSKSAVQMKQLAVAQLKLHPEVTM